MNYKIERNKIDAALKFPEGKLKVVIDSDAYNEVDDQFAIAWALKSKERMDVQAVYAAPFCSKALQKLSPIPNETLKKTVHYAGTPAEGMEKSYKEILNLFNILGENAEGRVYRGAKHYIEENNEPVNSEAVQDLIYRAMHMENDERLYVLAIGAVTNVASAIMLQPKIIDKITVIWLGGQPLDFKCAGEFNLMQDMPASKLMFDCGVPLVLIPCMTVASHLTLTKAEIEERMLGKSKIGDYLGSIVQATFNDALIPMSDLTIKMGYLSSMDDVPLEIAKQHLSTRISWSRIIWDISTVGYLLSPNWSASSLVPSPILNDDMSWSQDPARHNIRLCHYLSRNHILGDMFWKFAEN